MSLNPVNLALRFLLEIAALVAMAYWGWTQHEGLVRFLWTLGLPLLAAVLWGTFRVPNDPGPAPVAVPGAVRLLLEIAFFATAVTLLFAAGRSGYATVYGLLLVLHYLVSYDRLQWLLSPRPS